MKRLKRCPFCGGQAEIQKGESDPECAVGMGWLLFSVRCKSCGCQTPWFPSSYLSQSKTKYSEGEQQAVDTWEKRVFQETKSEPKKGRKGELIFGGWQICERCHKHIKNKDWPEHCKKCGK